MKANKYLWWTSIESHHLDLLVKWNKGSKRLFWAYNKLSSAILKRLSDLVKHCIKLWQRVGSKRFVWRHIWTTPYQQVFPSTLKLKSFSWPTSLFVDSLSKSSFHNPPPFLCKTILYCFTKTQQKQKNFFAVTFFRPQNSKLFSDLHPILLVIQFLFCFVLFCRRW